MIEGFIVVIISLLFWGKVSKDALENNPKMDIVKTIVYLTLSIILGIIYYKSSQVEISENRIDIRKLACTTNQKGERSDSVAITVNYRMTHGNVNYMSTYTNFNPLGGVDFQFKSKRSYRNLSIDSTKLRNIYDLLYHCIENPDLNKDIPEKSVLGKIIERYKEEIFQFRPNMVNIEKRLFESSNGITREDSIVLIDALQYIFKDQRDLYFITYLPPKRKTFLPIDFAPKDEMNYVEGKDDKYSFGVKSKRFLEEFVDPAWEKEGIGREEQRKEFDSDHMTAYLYYLGSTNIPDKETAPNTTKTRSYLNLISMDSLFNYVDYFTASDMNQRVFKISVFSEVPLYALAINFDEPINVSEIWPSPDIIGMNQIVYLDSIKLDYFRDKSLQFHAKLPTYENKQLLRSLVLTTILTAVFSLFCTNLYLCGRGLIRRFASNVVISDEEKEKYKKRISIYQYSVIAAVILFAAIPIWLYIRYLNNNSILLRTDNVISIIGYTIFALLTAIFVFYIWKSKLIPKGKDKEKRTNILTYEENLHS